MITVVTLHRCTALFSFCASVISVCASVVSFGLAQHCIFRYLHDDHS